jgi:hypothetical protein
MTYSPPLRRLSCSAVVPENFCSVASEPSHRISRRFRLNFTGQNIKDIDHEGARAQSREVTDCDARIAIQRRCDVASSRNAEINFRVPPPADRAFGVTACLSDLPPEDVHHY